MAEYFGPIYEVTHTIEPEIAAEFDQWLAQHVEHMLSVEGITRAETCTVDDEAVSPLDNEGLVRVSRYFFDSDESLEKYLAGPAATMRQSAVNRFKDQFSVSRHVLRQSASINEEEEQTIVCQNCESILSGQYCGHCGQRSKSRLISIWELVQDAFGDLFELDSRLWRTLIPLAMRPGKLTRDYLEGKRARYMPPFRTYLVLSIAFFVFAFFDPSEELGILLDSPPGAPVTNSDEDADGFGEGLIAGFQDEFDEEIQREAASQGSQNESPTESESIAASQEDDTGGANGLTFSIDNDGADSDGDCNDIDSDDWPDWLASRLTAERLRVACERVIADDGQAFLGKLLDNVPAALIALLPLMALVLKALYPLSKRYYVEHVLFVVHFHAFVFFILTLQILVARLISFVGFPDLVWPVTTFAVMIYIPVYLFKALRHVYGQSGLVTALKYLILLLAYMIGLVCILLFTSLVAAFAI